jgi:hypothetical protein
VFEINNFIYIIIAMHENMLDEIFVCYQEDDLDPVRSPCKMDEITKPQLSLVNHPMTQAKFYPKTLISKDPKTI